MFVLFLSFMLGLSLLLPWNSLLKSLPYMMTRVPLEWRGIAPLWLTLTFTLTNCLVLLGLTVSDADSRLIRKCFGSGSGRRINTETVIGMRLYGGLIGCAVLLVLACLSPLSDLLKPRRDEGSMASLVLFGGIFVCSGWTMCLLQRSVYPMMSLIPGKRELMVPAMLTGQAMAGISALMGSFLLAGGSSGSRGGEVALVYFGCSIVALVCTAGLYYYYELRKGRESKQDVVVEESEEKGFSMGMLVEAAGKIKPWPQLLALNFAVTLSVFPGLLTSSARSLHGNKYFVPLTFLVFDIFDLLGKVMPSVYRRGLGPRSKLAMGFPVGRILLIPVFLLLPNFGLIKTGFRGDWLYFGVLSLMAWTSGWGNAICLINGPQSAPDASKEMNDRIGSMLGLSITFGLLCGSAASFLLKTTIF